MKKFIFKVAEKFGYTETEDKENIYDMCFSLFYAVVFVFVCYIFVCIAYTKIWQMFHVKHRWYMGGTTPHLCNPHPRGRFSTISFRRTVLRINSWKNFQLFYKVHVHSYTTFLIKKFWKKFSSVFIRLTYFYSFCYVSRYHNIYN